MELKLPEETVNIFHEYLGLIECRNESAKSHVAYKRAGFYEKMALEKRYEFWSSVKEVYPKYKDKDMNFDIETGILTVKEGD